MSAALQPLAPPRPADPPAGLALGRLALVPDLSGALWLPDEATLVVADLHLEKGSSYAARGVRLPPYDTRATLARLAEAVARLRPRRVVALGDTWHDTGGCARLDPADRAAIEALQVGRDWLWILGNHDPHPVGIGGDTASACTIAGVRLTHAPTTEPGPEIAGHLHPCAVVRLRGRGLRRRCFVAASHRVVLPAMGAYAGGLDVCDDAFRPLFPDAFTAHLLGGARVFAVGHRLLRRG